MPIRNKGFSMKRRSERGSVLSGANSPRNVHSKLKFDTLGGTGTAESQSKVNSRVSINL